MHKPHWFTCLLLMSIATCIWAASGDLDQARNGGIGDPPISPVQWVNGNLNQSHSHYVEGQSVPYRLVLQGLSLGPHYVIIGWDIRTGGRNALDYLTHFQRIAETVDPLSGLAGSFDPPNTFPIPEPIPTAMGRDALQPQTSFNSLRPDQRLFTIYNGTITNLTYVNNADGNLGDLTASSSESRLRIDFVANSPTVVLAWGAHIAANFDWGEGKAAANIQGSSYHTRFIELDGTGGNQDRSLSAKAVCVLPECTIVGPETVCESSPTIYECASYDPLCTYQWSIQGDAGITGPIDGPSVTVQPAESGSFTLELLVSRPIEQGGCSSKCSKRVVINDIPGCGIWGPTPVYPNQSGLIYEGPEFDGTYRWSISGNGTIDGATNLRTVSVTAGPDCEKNFTLKLTLEKNGCVQTCEYVVAVEDNTPPTISCPPDREYEYPHPDNSPSVAGSATATDDSGNVEITYTDVQIPGCGNTYTIARTWTAKDSCGNDASCVQTISIVDTTPPVINCPNDVLGLEIPALTDPDHTGFATATDANGIKSITYQDTIIPLCGATVRIERVWIAKDLCDNESKCTQLIITQDTTPPTISCPPDLTLELGAPTDPDHTGRATATDAGGDVVITFADAEIPHCGRTKTITRTWTATDACGNSSSCVQTIEVVDTTPPDIHCPPNVTIEYPGETDPDHTGYATATDAGGNVTITYSDTEVPGCGNTKTITRTWKAEDECGNIATCIQMIYVVDTTPPTINCPKNKIYTPETFPYDNWQNEFGVPDVWDANGEVTLTWTDSGPLGECPTIYVRTFKATDVCGNTSTCSQKLIIIGCAGIVTNSSLCTVPNDTWRLIFSPDMGDLYFRLNASNPGQCFYNVFYVGQPGQSVTFDLTIPWPFVTQGANPVHAYSFIDVNASNGEVCLTPIDPIYVGSQKIALESYAGGQSYTFPVTLAVPDTGFIYLNVHLDYGLKGTAGYLKDSKNNAIDYLTKQIRIAEGRAYAFIVGNATSGGSIIYTTNSFKKNQNGLAGVSGICRDITAGVPIAGATIVLKDSQGTSVGSATTDSEGFYVLPYAHKGSPAVYDVVFTWGTITQVKQVSLKSNGTAIANFDIATP